MSQPPSPAIANFASATSIPIPQHWSPEQALAVWECLTDLAECIWNCYEVSLIELIRPDLEPPDTSQHDLFDPDDDIPF